jgi:zinc and cadmium transporter
MDTTFAWIVGSGVAMSAIALIGSVTLLLSDRAMQCILLPLVAFAAGSLLGGAFFHLLPVGLAAGMTDHIDVSFLVPFAAGNFIYIGASDLIPEVKTHANAKANRIHFAAYVMGVALMLAVKLALEPSG